MAARLALIFVLGTALALTGCGGGGGGGGGGAPSLAQITQNLQACAQDRTAEMMRLLDTGAGVLLGRIGTVTPDPLDVSRATFNAPFDLDGDGTDDTTFSGEFLNLGPDRVQVTWMLTGAATGSGVFVVEGDVRFGIATVTGNGDIQVGTCGLDILLAEPFPLQLSVFNVLPQPAAAVGGANIAGTATVMVNTPGHQMSATLDLAPDSNDVSATGVLIDEMPADDFAFTLPGMDPQAVERVGSCIFSNINLFFTLFNNLLDFAQDGNFDDLVNAGYEVEIIGLNVYRVTGPLADGFTVQGTVELSGLPVVDYTGTARISYDISNEDQTIRGTSGDTPLFFTFDNGDLDTFVLGGTFNDDNLGCQMSFSLDDSVSPIPVQIQVTSAEDNFQASYMVDDSGLRLVFDVLSTTYNGQRIPDTLALILLEVLF